MIYAEFRAANGVLIRVHDDLLPEPGSAEERHREDVTARIIDRIDESCAEDETA